MSASRLLSALILLALPWVATAQTGQDAGRFRGLDRNGDGVITRAEWRGNAQSFNMHDWNNDGVLSGDEVREQGGREVPWEEIDFDPDADLEVTDWTPQAFNNLDRNRDGRVTRNEWHFDLETFRRVDSNNNNSISRAEFLGGAGAAGSPASQFDALDRDNSGRVEFSEWNSTRASFNRLDRNRDGMLTRAEMRGGAGVGVQARNQFASVDYNRDGVISADEWHWSQRSFDQRDLNRDGVLTRREFTATAGLATTTDVARASNEMRDARVDPRDRWTSTGIYVNTGELVSWEADGTIRMSTDNSDTSTPSGSTRGRRASNAPIREALAGGLLMKVGDSVVRFVGTTGSFRASTAGELFLGVNDDHLADNSGEYRVRLTVGR